MFRLAHISDLHLGPMPKVKMRELFSKRITGYLNWHRHRKVYHQINTLSSVMTAIRSFKPDHLAITGDLVNIATNDEIALAKLWLEKNCTPNQTSLVPGNHDAYVPGAFNKSTRSWRSWMDGQETSKNKIFPYFKKVENIAIVGFSTSNATLPLRATGNFTKKQAQKGAELLNRAAKENLFRIILIHHPPYAKATHSMKKMIGLHHFNEMMKTSGAELILHGHTHLNTVHMADYHGKKIPIIGTSSASQIDGDRKPAAGFNFFEIKKNGANWNCLHRRYKVTSNQLEPEIIEQNQLYQL